MRLYERFGDSGFHTCIATSFGIDFDAFENIALPRLRGAHCANMMLLIDEAMLSYALDGASTLPEHAGRYYTVTGVPARSVFHPKIILQLGRSSGRVIISSANMTASGLAGNLELAGVLACRPDQRGEASLIAAAWAFLQPLLETNARALDHQLDWLRRRTAWLSDVEPASGSTSLVDGSAAAFLTTSGDGAARGIGSRFADLVDGERVKRLVVLSPYWDEQLAALKTLQSMLRPEQTILLIDQEKQLFPSAAALGLERTEIRDRGTFGESRFIHAKALIAETEHADHVLYGSANCTAAAMGTGNYSGGNNEACLYRRLSPGSILDALGLSRIIEEGAPIPIKDLPAFRRDEVIPLAEAARRSPGQFEYAFGILYWKRPSGLPADGVSVELTDSADRPLLIGLAALGASPEGISRFPVDGMRSRPAFARLRFADGTSSAPAVIAVLDDLRENVREARGRKAELAAFQLSSETEEGLWLWEVLETLEAADLDQEKKSPGAKRPEKKDAAREGGSHQTLDYDQFIAGRQLRRDREAAASNSLAGTELSLVRSFLNRILTLADRKTEASPPDEEIANGLELGDETGDAASALEHGEDFSAPSRALAPSALPEEERRARVARERESRAQIAQAVTTFITCLRDKNRMEELHPPDVLRLRAILMIIAAAGQPKKHSRNLTSLQVLPSGAEADAWPRLVGQVLFAFFGGNQPAIQRLKIDMQHDQLPTDLVESWATALWALQACICTVKDQPSLRQSLLPFLSGFAGQLYARTGLRQDELDCLEIRDVFGVLNDRFCGRLGISAEGITRGHVAASRSLSRPA